MTSYFLANKKENKDANTYYPWEIKLNKDYIIEMYNTTMIYAVPITPGLPTKFKFSFEVYQADEFQNGGHFR